MLFANHTNCQKLILKDISMHSDRRTVVKTGAVLAGALLTPIPTQAAQKSKDENVKDVFSPSWLEFCWRHARKYWLFPDRPFLHIFFFPFMDQQISWGEHNLCCMLCYCAEWHTLQLTDCRAKLQLLLEQFRKKYCKGRESFSRPSQITRFSQRYFFFFHLLLTPP